MKTLADFVAAARAANTIFSVVFIKKTTGELRQMQARMHVKKGVTGALAPGQRRAEDARCNVLTVFDIGNQRKLVADGVDDETAAKRSFRRINVAGLQSVAMNGERWNVTEEGELVKV